MNATVKWVSGAIVGPVIAIIIYLAAVFQVYILAWVVQIIGNIFG